MKSFALAFILFLGVACNGPVKKDIPREQEHPMLIKTIGSPEYGNVQCSLEDQSGNLWFGTTENGLYKYDGSSFQRFMVSDGLNSNAINHLLQDRNGKIWIGTDKGLCIYDGKSFTEVSIPLPKYLPPNKNELYKSLKIFHIMQDRSGKLWIATIDGVFTYDGTSFTHFVINKGAGGFLSTNHNVERIFEDKDGYIWFGGRTNVGVYRYDGKTITNFKLEGITLNFKSVNREVTHDWAWPQLQDKNGNIWFSNWGGAYRYDGKSFATVTGSDGLPGYNGIVKTIVEDDKGNLWFGGDLGLSRFDGRSFTNFRHGLINTDIWTILRDKYGKIWVGTRATGLYLFDGKKFTNYSEYRKQPEKK
jgi:ligand-binding sensor domain-containing protein